MMGGEMGQLLAEIERLREENAYYKRELGLRDDTDRQHAFIRRWRLTRTEARYLDVLYARAGRLVTTDAAMAALYGSSPDEEPGVRIIAVYTCKVRAKIGRDAIDVVWGQGHRLTPAGVALCYSVLQAEKDRLAA